MFKNIKNIFFLLSFSSFLILITVFYFSDENVSSTNKSRTLFLEKVNSDIQNLPLLKSDTDNIIEYSDDVEIFKKKRKNYKFFDLLKIKDE